MHAPAVRKHQEHPHVNTCEYSPELVCSAFSFFDRRKEGGSQYSEARKSSSKRRLIFWISVFLISLVSPTNINLSKPPSIYVQSM